MSIWHGDITINKLNKMAENTLIECLGITFTEIEENYLSATMPVCSRTQQPMGLLHGGASCVLEETLGSMASMWTVDKVKYTCLGLEINANHINSITEGNIIGSSYPIHLGRGTQI